MGIIEKQATRNAIYSYLGAGLGFITTIWFAHSLTTAENGLVRVMVSLSALISQFANLGFQTVTIRFFPFFRNKEKGHNGFLYYSMLVALIGFSICFLLFFLFQDKLIESNIEKSKLFVEYLYYLMPLTFFTLFFNVFDSYLRAIFNSVVGSFTKEFIQRILILIVLAFYFLGYIGFSIFFLLYIVATCLPTLMLLFTIIKNDEWHVKPVKDFFTQELKNDIFKMSIYSILSGGAGAIILNVDAIMVNQLLGESKTGVYGIAFYFGTILVIPARSIYRITSSIVAEAFKKDNIKEIHQLYNKSCNTQLAIGLFLFIGIYTNIENIMSLLPAEYYSGKNVILLISAGYLIEMATGINQVIISNSKYFRYDTYFVFALVAIVIVANYIFIPLYGIVGSAVATAITIASGNGIRFLFLYYKYKMQPYDLNTLKLIAISIPVFFIGYFMPQIENTFLDILIRGTAVAVPFISLVYFTNATPDLNAKLRKILFAK
jgi:O-antigen/teichoic acid export membrane protein